MNSIQSLAMVIDTPWGMGGGSELAAAKSLVALLLRKGAYVKSGKVLNRAKF